MANLFEFKSYDLKIIKNFFSVDTRIFSSNYMEDKYKFNTIKNTINESIPLSVPFANEMLNLLVSSTFQNRLERLKLLFNIANKISDYNAWEFFKDLEQSDLGLIRSFLGFNKKQFARLLTPIYKKASAPSCVQKINTTKITKFENEINQPFNELYVNALLYLLKRKTPKKLFNRLQQLIEIAHQDRSMCFKKNGMIYIVY